MKRDKNRFTGDSDLWVFIPKEDTKMDSEDKNNINLSSTKTQKNK